MRCPHCRRKLAIRFRGRAFFIAAVVIGLVVCIFALFRGWPHFPAATLVTRFAIIVVGWFLLEHRASKSQVGVCAAIGLIVLALSALALYATRYI